MKRLLAAGLALLLMGQAPSPARVSDLGWMSGRWMPETWNERWEEEIWSEPRGGIMLGYGRSGNGERLREFELLRIQAGEDGVPQRIRYERAGGETMMATISKLDGSNAIRSLYRRQH